MRCVHFATYNTLFADPVLMLSEFERPKAMATVYSCVRSIQQPKWSVIGRETRTVSLVAGGGDDKTR